MKHHAFVYLLKQELKWHRDRRKRNWWSLLYILLGVAIGLTFFTYAIHSGQFQLQYMWFFTFGFPFIMMGVAYSTIAKEWKNRMYSWWLSLPYSKETLMASKLFATWIQVLVLFVLAFGLLVIFSVYVVVLRSDISLSLLLEHLLGGLSWLLVLLAFYPFVASFSYLTFTSVHTKYRTVTPLLWIVLIVAINGLFWVIKPNGFAAGEQVTQLFRIDFTYVTAVAIVLSWVLAWGLFKIVARLLDKQLIV